MKNKNNCKNREMKLPNIPKQKKKDRRICLSFIFLCIEYENNYNT